MGFLKKLFGGNEKKVKKHIDKQSIYFYVQVDGKDSRVRVRADKQHDLMRTESGFVWHKTIVDSKYFKRMNAVVHFDGQHNITNSELDGGVFISKEQYEAAETAVSPPPTPDNVTHPTDE